MGRKDTKSAFDKKLEAVAEVNPAIYEAGIDASLKDPTAFLDSKVKPPEWLETTVAPHVKLRQDIEDGTYELSDLPDFDAELPESGEEAAFGVTDRALIPKYKAMGFEEFEYAVAIGEVGRWWYRRAAWLVAMCTKQWDVYLDLNRGCPRKKPKVTYGFMKRMWEERDWVLCALFAHYNKLGVEELFVHEKQRLITPGLKALEKGANSTNEQVAVASSKLIFELLGHMPRGGGASATANATATASVINNTYKQSESPARDA